MRVTRAYLDHAATAPLRPEAGEEFLRVARELGNPNAIHTFGRNARRYLDEAREEVAELLGAEPAEVIFTSGGTEADNLAVQGGWFAASEERPGIIVSAVEHPAVIETAHWLRSQHGAKLHVAPVTSSGAVDLTGLSDYLEADAGVSVISVMWANNETGVLQPIREIVELASRNGVRVHSDAVQAAAHMPIDFHGSGLSALSISGHKIGAPVGIGALLAQREFTPTPHMHGGLQERGIRSGTVNAAGAAALAAALRSAVRDQVEEAARLRRLREQLQDAIRAAVPASRIWGEEEERLPGHLLVSVPGTRSEAVLFSLDMAGVAASAGSACQAGVVGASPVVLAMGGTEEEARSALRFTLGYTTTQADIDAALELLPTVFERARAAFA